MLTQLFGYLLCAVAVRSVVSTLWEKRHDSLFRLPIEIWRRFSFRMLLLVCLNMAMIIAASRYLMSSSKFLAWSWVQAVVGTDTNLYYVPLAAHGGFLVKLGQVIFFLGLLWALPFLAHYEEVLFRAHQICWKKIGVRSFAFGLIHFPVGAPLGVCFCIGLGGLFFAYIYRREYLHHCRQDMSVEWANRQALLLSSSYHTMHNTIIAVLMLIVAMSRI